MTSTISSKNKNFGKLFKWALGRNKALIIVFSVLMILGIIIDVQALTAMAHSRIYNYDDSVGSVGYGSILIAQLGAVFFSIISATHTFNFLHNKRSTDMFGAVPATRSTLYFSHLLGGITAISIPFTVGSFVVMALTCRSLHYFVIELGFILMGIVGIAAVYSFAVLIAYCCGTALDSTIITLGANGIYMGVVGIFTGAAYDMIPGLSGGNMFFNTPIITLFAPVGFSFFFDGYCIMGQMTGLWTTVIWSILFTAGVILLGNYAAKTRKAETAQNEFNIKWLPVVIKAGMSVLAGGFAGAISASNQGSGFSNMFVFAFWYIIVGFAAFIILHLIFSRGMKVKLLPSLLVFAGTTAAALGLMFAMTTGLGIDTYIPAEGNISSVVFSGEEKEFKDPENIRTIIEIHRLMAEGTLKSTPRPYYLGSNYDYEYYYGDYDSYELSDNTDYRAKYPLMSNTNYVIKYNKKFGFNTERYYAYGFYTDKRASNFDCDKIEELLKKLYSSDEYKKLSHPELWNSEGVKKNGVLPVTADIDIIGYSGKTNTYSSRGDIRLKTDEKFLNGLVDALKKDILDDKEYYKNRIAGTDYYDPAYIGERYYYVSIGYGEKSISNIRETINVQVFENYTNTLNYLRKNGYASELDNPSFSVDDPDYTDYYTDDYINDI